MLCMLAPVQHIIVVQSGAKNSDGAFWAPIYLLILHVKGNVLQSYDLNIINSHSIRAKHRLEDKGRLRKRH